MAAAVATALQAENIAAMPLYRPDEVDYHVYTHWTPIVAKRAWTQTNMPWSAAANEVDYSPAACPHTLDLLSRAVHLDVNPLLSNQEVEEMIEGVNRVLATLT